MMLKNKHILRLSGATTVALLLAAPAIASAAAPVMIDLQTCRRVVMHTPAADVAHQTGRDSRGRPVAPPGVESTLDLPRNFSVDVSVLLDDQLTGSGAPVGEVHVAQVDVDEHGRASVGGQPLGSAVEGQLAAVCQDTLRLAPR